MALSEAERKANQRERDKLKIEQKEALLLAYRLTLDIYKGTAKHIDRCMAVSGIEEPQDVITRLIHRCADMTDEQLADWLARP